jgi:hypothetical protein
VTAVRKLKTDDTLPDMPKHPEPGDRVKLKSERIGAYNEACKAAGYEDFDPYAVHVVVSTEPWQSNRRLRVERQPFYFGQNDVNLAWNTDGERREELRKRGWRV